MYVYLLRHTTLYMEVSKLIICCCCYCETKHKQTQIYKLILILISDSNNSSNDYDYKNECLVFAPSAGAHRPKPGMETIYNSCMTLVVDCLHPRLRSMCYVR